MRNSVRAMQYIPDISKTAKIPEDLFHKLPNDEFRIWPLALWPYPEHCKVLVFFR